MSGLCFSVWTMPFLGETRTPNLLKFGTPRAGRRPSESQPFIHEKWRRSREMLAPGTGDLERLRLEDLKVKLILRRLRVVVRGLQMICSYGYSWRLCLFKVIDRCVVSTEFGHVQRNAKQLD